MLQSFLKLLKVFNEYSGIITVPTLVLAYVTFKKSKKVSQREASYQHVLDSFINREIKYNKTLLENKVLTTRQARWHYLSGYFPNPVKKEEWVHTLLFPKNDPRTCFIHQVCFELIDCLETLGEAYFPGLFQIGLAIHFVGNNFIEDWFCVYPWVYKLRMKENGNEDVYLKKRMQAELMAKLALANFLCDYRLETEKQAFLRAFFRYENIILTLEAFGHHHDGFCQALIEKIQSQASSGNGYSQLRIKKQEERIYLDQITGLLGQEDPEKVNDVLIFVVAADLLRYIKFVRKMTRKKLPLVTLPDDFSRITTHLIINLQKVCFLSSKSVSEKYIPENKIKDLKRLQCGWRYCWNNFEWNLSKGAQTFLDKLM